MIEITITITITNGVYNNINGDITAIFNYRKIHNRIVKIICDPPFESNEKQLINDVCDYINSKTNLTIRTNHNTENISKNEWGKISELTFQIL